MTEPEQRPGGGLRSAGTRPINFVVQSPPSVGSSRCGFKWPGDFESGKAGGAAEGRPPSREPPRPPRPRAQARPRGFVSGVAPRTSPCAACNPSSHFLVDSLKAAAVAARNKGHCLASSCGAASFPESPFLDRGPRAAPAPRGGHKKSPQCAWPRSPPGAAGRGGSGMNPPCGSRGHAARFPKGALFGAAPWAPRAPPPRPAVIRAFISWWLL